jgi:hypothetical protein
MGPSSADDPQAITPKAINAAQTGSAPNRRALYLNRDVGGIILSASG